MYLGLKPVLLRLSDRQEQVQVQVQLRPLVGQPRPVGRPSRRSQLACTSEEPRKRRMHVLGVLDLYLPLLRTVVT